MRILLIGSFIVSFILPTKNKEYIERGDIEKSDRDSLVNLQLITKYKTGESEFFQALDEYPVDVFLFKKELYLLSYSENKLVIVDTEKKTTKTNARINDVIRQNSGKYFGVQQVIINDKYFFIGFLKGVICLSKDGVVVGSITSEDNIIHLSIDNEFVIVFYRDNIVRFNTKGQKLESYKVEDVLTGNFFNINNQVYVNNVNELLVYNLEELAKSKKNTVPFSNFPFKEPYLTCITAKYTVWYPYITRDQVALLDRSNYTLVKTMKFNNEKFKPTEEEIEFEEGNPNFEVVADDSSGVYYIVALKNKVLSTYRIN